MKKLSLMLLIGLSAMTLLTGCSKKEEVVEEPVVEEPVEEEPVVEEPVEEEPVEEEPEEEPDIPPEEGMVRSTLSNEWIRGDIADQRPIAVMVPNDPSALPHYSLSQADVLYECQVEGDITRLMAVIKDWDREDMDRIGNIRSCRDYFVYWALEYDSIYIHFGGPFYIAPIIETPTTDNISGANYGEVGKVGVYGDAFYRANNAKAPQNAYTGADKINKAINALGYSKTYTSNYDPDHFNFVKPGTENTLEQYPNAIDVKKLDMAPAYPVSKTYFEYNPDDGLYYRYEVGKPHIDAAFDNQQLAFKNVIVQFAYYEVRDAKGYLAYQDHDTTRDGFYLTNGKAIHVNWTKTSDYGATKYYDDDGNEIEMNTGKTMICIVQEGDSIDYE